MKKTMTCIEQMSNRERERETSDIADIAKFIHFISIFFFAFHEDVDR